MKMVTRVFNLVFLDKKSRYIFGCNTQYANIAKNYHFGTILFNKIPQSLYSGKGSIP